MVYIDGRGTSACDAACIRTGSFHYFSIVLADNYPPKFVTQFIVSAQFQHGGPHPDGQKTMEWILPLAQQVHSKAKKRHMRRPMMWLPLERPCWVFRWLMALADSVNGSIAPNGWSTISQGLHHCPTMEAVQWLLNSIKRYPFSNPRAYSLGCRGGPRPGL